jgi:predicted acylesterase/phospholipase RssA
MMTEANDPRIAADAARETQRHADIACAKATLRGEQRSAQELYLLAERLRKVNEFGLARRLYGQLRSLADWAGLTVTEAKVAQRQALSTYRDPDLPATERFQRALEILDHVDRLDLGAPPPGAARPGRSERLEIEQRQESLGLRGAIYKRRWQIEAQRIDLEHALGFYLRGYQIGRAFTDNELGVETDQGYAGINAAYVLDLLAREDAKQAGFSGIEPALARQRTRQAKEIRSHLVAALPALVQQADYGWLNEEWWFHATLAEAQLGLGEVGPAITTLRNHNTAHRLSHDGPPLEQVPRWEFESTITQLISLAHLQAELSALLRSGGGPPGSASRGPAPTLSDADRRAFSDYLGSFAPALERAETGKLGLALSGGGFRASLFHIGVLAKLAERDLLRRIEVLSCVSGGSIVGAHFYLEVQRLLETKSDGEVSRSDYVEVVERVLRDFVAGVQSNIRSRVFASVWANLRALLQPGYTTTRHLGALYEKWLYARIEDGRQAKPRHLEDLVFRPKGESDAFKPKYDNWRRRAKIPTLVLNATTLNTGHNWQFTGSWMGEPPIGLDAEIEGNYRLRRMYHREAPRLKSHWKHWLSRPFAPPDYQRIRLGEAVAASSCVPGLFEPIVLPDLYEGKVVRLVDGGVHDNQGIASLLEQDCNVMIVSDASGQMGAQDDPANGRLGVSLRSFSISMTRVRQAQYRELAARRRSGLLKRLVFLHLKRDLDADPVDWRECQDPHDASDETRSPLRRGVLTGFGLQKSVQRSLSEIRTDLDSFTDLEAFSLMTSGYRQAETQLESQGDWPASVSPERPWPFLAIEPLLSPGPHFDEAKRLLAIGGKTAFKAWLVSPTLHAVGIALLTALACASLVLGWKIRGVPIATFGEVGWLALGIGAAAIAPRIVSFARYRQTLRTASLKGLLGLALALGFRIHLAVFDRLFLARGSMDRFRESPGDE